MTNAVGVKLPYWIIREGWPFDPDGAVWHIVWTTDTALCGKLWLGLSGWQRLQDLDGLGGRLCARCTDKVQLRLW